MENKKDDLVQWDCLYYKTHKVCSILREMTCRNKKCKFYKKIGACYDKD